MFAREPAILRAAARHAATKVRSDRDHAIELIAYYEGLIEARKRRAA
jgi:alpha-1,6-mannosyltransferase